MKQHPIYTQYTISEDGQVWKNGKLKKQAVTSNGYHTTWITEARTHKKIHRLVAETYIPNPDNLPQVNHIDRDKSNNHVSNLEWCDNQHNCEHALAKIHKLKTPSGETIEVYNLGKWCRDNGVDRGDLYKGKSPHGYKLTTI